MEVEGETKHPQHIKRTARQLTYYHIFTAAASLRNKQRIPHPTSNLSDSKDSDRAKSEDTPQTERQQSHNSRQRMRLQTQTTHTHTPHTNKTVTEGTEETY